ncbi:MAG: ABC transporter ATP-binding protein [Muribaculaceae bacterium]|nr:ABC transporter ATP-binding protein [Muribaculaceae bacterium]
MIDIRKLSVGYGARTVLGPFDSRIEAGTVTVLIGANGAGKSTLLRTLAGVQQPLGGEVLYDDVNLHAGTTPRSRARLVSLVYSERNISADLTIEEIVALGRQPYTGLFGNLSNDDRRIVAESIATLGITHLAHRTAGTLSDGERQKALIARALAQSTPVMLLDEPTSFLDAASRIDVMQQLRRIAAEKRVAILLSTHDIAPALDVAHNLWVIERPARSILCGSRAEVLSTGAMDRVFDSATVYFDERAGDYRGRSVTSPR